MMRITIEIDDSTLADIQHATGIEKKSPAVTQALRQYLRQRQKSRLIQKALRGETDFSLTNDELEDLALYEAD